MKNILINPLKLLQVFVNDRGPNGFFVDLNETIVLVFVQNPDVPIENTTDCLSTMASVCKVMLETP